MKSLNISNNRLKAEGAKHIAAALPECKYVPYLISPDHRITHFLPFC